MKKEKKEKKYGLFKAMFIMILVAILLTWLIPNGAFGADAFSSEGTLTRVGLNDLAWLVYYGIWFSIDKIILLLVIGGFYGVLTKTSAYNRLVTGIANKLSKKKLAVVIFSVIIAVLTSLLTQVFVVLIFIPFIVSILNRMNLDKITIMATTFGSMLVGMLGATYGTEGLVFLNQYLASETVDFTTGVLVRGGILLIGLVLFNFFTLTHMSKVDKNSESADMFAIDESLLKVKIEDTRSIAPLIFLDIIAIIMLSIIYLILAVFTMVIVALVVCGLLFIALIVLNVFKIQSYKEHKNEKVEGIVTKSTIPMIIIGVLTFIIAVLGYVNWEANFGITVFNKFHDFITGLSIGDFAVFTNLLGTNMTAFGAWEDVFSMVAILMVFTVILAICYRVKPEEFFENYGSGLKVVLKPIACVIGAFVLMVVVYMSPYLATIINKFLAMTDGFNLATMTLTALLANIFHTDLGYTGYILGSYLTAEYVDYINPIYTIFISLYGFVQFFIPTSAVLGVGLTALGVKYTDWLKYIWKFLVGMFICLLVIFILIAML